ncbi:glycoside hydrolase family 9 protein [Carboxylicivirga sp. N1Y90]|uniref:glycoside hydrolase family 9 protein n=1 Tax=Carboxylicivirga fragile TaxID=3417571 RepID=UPI003D346A90|nr:glycoside hydrolase family 9 protein [Marinilabiliaceae bacterium N1Y90]
MKSWMPVVLSLSFLFVLMPCKAQQNIFINQAGYLPSSQKHVYVDYQAESFSIINRETAKPVFTGELTIRSEKDVNTGLSIYEGDFSTLTEPGDYLVKIKSSLNSGITSYPFKISTSPYANLIEKANKSLFLQRCGMDLLEEYAGEHHRCKCHLDDAKYHPTAALEGNKDVTGGWHDAGDYGKYIAAGSVTSAYLLLAYELAPVKHYSDSWGIPESGNGISDLLDEIKYEVDWMLKMQREDGAVHEKVHTKLYADFMMPGESKTQRYIYEVSSTATADFVAIMARVSRVYESIDQNFSDRCKKAALKSYAYLQKHPDIFPEGGFKNPADTKAGGYSDAYDKDERLWAATELFILTGKKKYYHDYQLLKEVVGSSFSEASWANPSTLAYYTMLFSDNAKIDEVEKKALKASLIEYCDRHVAIAEKDGFRTGMLANDFVWGSTSSVLKKAINLIYGYELTGNEAYKNLAISHMDYIVGVNVHKISFVTGVGTKRILHLHHAPSIADMHAEPIPGILSGGPNKFLNDAALQNAFDENTPPAKCFVDDVESYASNENTISGHSVLYFVATYIDGLE